MDDEDRKKVFWLLKKYSSYTAWKALAEAYAEFLKAWEYAMEHADFTTHTDWYKTILDGQIAFEKGLPLLREGQRSVFRNSSTGYLGLAARATVFINRIMDPEEFIFDWMPNKNEVMAAHAKLEQRVLGLFSVRERPNLETPASFGKKSIFNLIYGPFNIPCELHPVPAPTTITCSTGEELSRTGIWEPEWTSASGLLKSLTATPSRLEKGCMNYLLAGAIAPKYQDGELDPKIDVTWRLIWEDKRYLDGTIPEEEKEYLAEVETPSAHPSRIRGLPEEVVPKTGWWHSPAKPNGEYTQWFEAGQRFPDIHSTSYGNVIWGYDPQEQAAPPKK